MIIAHCCQPGRGDHHHLALAADLLLGDVAEGFDNDRGLLLQIVRMQFFIPLNGLNRFGCRHLRVLRRVAGDLVAHLVGHIVGQHVQNETFFDSLLHGVDVEGMERPIRSRLAKYFQRLPLGGCGECKEG